MYEEIKNHKAAIEMVRAIREVGCRSTPLKKAARDRSLSTAQGAARILTPDEKAKGNPYRKDNPLHRAYFHEIAPPDKIAVRMKKLGRVARRGGDRSCTRSIARRAPTCG